MPSTRLVNVASAMAPEDFSIRDMRAKAKGYALGAKGENGGIDTGDRRQESQRVLKICFHCRSRRQEAQNFKRFLHGLKASSSAPTILKRAHSNQETGK